MVVRNRVVYPDSDGKRMAENMLQYQWIVMLHANLEHLFIHRADVLVAADNLIYPKEGFPKVCLAPDVYMAFGRPKGNRGSYKVWEEGGIFPQVVFEVLSPNNRPQEMADKFKFYEKWGAEEYFVIDPEPFGKLEIWQRQGRRLEPVPEPTEFVSPRTGIRFQRQGEDWQVIGPQGRVFRTLNELNAAADEAEQERRKAEQERRKAEQERRKAEQAQLEIERLEALLRKHGIRPDSDGNAKKSDPS
jgi:Uma2 family endonuclease